MFFLAVATDCSQTIAIEEFIFEKYTDYELESDVDDRLKVKEKDSSQSYQSNPGAKNLSCTYNSR